VLYRLVDGGHSVVVIEHDVDAMDWGPEGGVKGGAVVATCTPEELVKVKVRAIGQGPLLKASARDISQTHRPRRSTIPRSGRLRLGLRAYQAAGCSWAGSSSR
jgi:excinuclease ABC subunit A